MVIWVPHSTIADPNYPPVGVYPFHPLNSLVLILVFSHASWHRVMNVRGIHHRVVVLWHLEEDMNEQLVDLCNSLEGNHDPRCVALPSDLNQVAYDSSKAMPNKYQVTECVKTHASLVANSGHVLYTTE